MVFAFELLSCSLVSWGWQCGVSGKGARPKTLPAARLAIGGDLDHHVVQLESESALLVASLLAFMDMYSWKMPRMDMAMMGYGWDRQGRGRALGKDQARRVHHSVGRDSVPNAHRASPLSSPKRFGAIFSGPLSHLH